MGEASATATAAGASTPAPSTPGSRPTRRPAPSSRRSRCRRRSPRTASAATRASSTPRSGNPTRAALEACVASLESARHGLAFASGLAAEDNVLRLVPPGGRVVLGNDAYGGTFRLIAKVWGPLGMHVDGRRPHRRRRPRRATGPTDTAMVWLETPTNPLLTCIDIEAVAALAHEHGALVVVDNTFATPYLQQPLTLGADIVVHSATKYLGGHSDVVGGFVAVDDDGLADRLRFTQNAAGAVPGPFDCYLVLRGVKTLGRAHGPPLRSTPAPSSTCSCGHPAVERVLYPQLPDHPGHAAAAKQMRDFGGMVSFTLRGGAEAAKRVAAATELFTLAESLGAVESLIEHPGEMTHASVAGSPLEVPGEPAAPVGGHRVVRRPRRRPRAGAGRSAS